MNESKGLILEIQRLSTEDGPGIRTTVFMKGCPLACKWCHNPESIKPEPQIQWINSRCIGCKNCIIVCPERALTWDNGVIIDRTLCKGCGKCAESCPSTAMEILGRIWDVEKLTTEILKDKVYFEKSGGGVTISGGEGTFQSSFVAKLSENLSKNKIHVALDTCGFYSDQVLEKIFPFVDLFLYDIKEMDILKHIEFTGQSNELILKNLIDLSNKCMNNSNKKIWIRTPLIPSMTAREDNILKIAKFINENLSFDVVERWELCLFNNLCKDKYRRLGIKWELDDIDLISEKEADDFLSLAKSIITKDDFCYITGSKRLVEN
ncbi:MAG: glycyl-radical enzyme activating protein [Spirochaetales bacterium]|nr:glycyl-radical enzyme activating protein [Spirochaetales bacterium]